jgi:hypothetical protein
MHRTILALAAFLVVPGCALLTEGQCHADADQWTWRGEYDAVQGDQPWIEAYARTCRPYGVNVDEQAYLKGWDIGHAAFERRVNVAN